MEIYGFMHVATMNHWQDVFQEQKEKIINSGLLEKTKKIYIGIVGEYHDLFFDKSEIIFHDNNLKLFEFPTLKYLHNFCKNNEAKIWYIHTKGVSRPNHNGMEDWRKYMEYFIINKHKECIKALDEYDVCGVDWFENNDPYVLKLFKKSTNKSFFAGNFWWANSNYIKNLPEMNINDRWEAEHFIGTGNPKVKCFNHSRIHYYLENYPKSRYIIPKEI